MSTTLTETSARGVNFALWAIQGILAVAFGMAGFMKLATPIPELAANMAWAAEVPALMVRFIGLSELLGAIGLIVPALTRIKPEYTTYAAIGLVAVMVLAAIFHVVRGEYEFILINVILGGLAAFIAWGRHTKVPILAK